MTNSERALSFGAIADRYDRLRPTASDEALTWLVPDGCAVAVDLAAGTGLFTRALARHVPEVIAVEPDPRMREVLAARSPGVLVLEGRGESIPLPVASADAVFVSSAWHWFDPAVALPEIARVLRPGGRLGVIWTGRDREVDWVRDLDTRISPRAGAADGADGTESAVAGGSRRRRRREVELPDDTLFGRAATASFAFTRRMPIDDIVELLGTYSGLIVAPSAERVTVLEQARAALAERFPGATELEVPMRSWCWRAERQELLRTA
jgi:SAM-dependent methyltransferase